MFIIQIKSKLYLDHEVWVSLTSITFTHVNSHLVGMIKSPMTMNRLHVFHVSHALDCAGINVCRRMDSSLPQHEPHAHIPLCTPPHI